MSYKVYSSCENEKDETDQTQTMYMDYIKIDRSPDTTATSLCLSF